MCSCLVMRGRVSVLMFGGEGACQCVSVTLLLFCTDLDLTFSFDAFRMDK